MVGELEREGIFVDFINFIDSNVEESFKRGKLERMAADKKGEYEENKHIHNGDEITHDEDSIFHLNEMKSDFIISMDDVVAINGDNINDCEM